MGQATVASGDVSVREGGEIPHAVTIRILSPSFDPNYFISLDNIPLSTNVRQLKERLTSVVAGQPSAAQQRLIYRGRPLLNDNALLQDILEPSQDLLHSLHLVLPPRQVPSWTANAPAGTSSSINISSATPGSAAYQSNVDLSNPQSNAQNTSNLHLRTPLSQIPATSTSPAPGRADETRQFTHAQTLANYQRQLVDHANAGRVLLRRAREIHGNFATEGINQASISDNHTNSSEPQQRPFSPSVPSFPSAEAQPIRTRWGQSPSPLQPSLARTIAPQTITGLTGSPVITTAVNVTFTSPESTIQILMVNRLNAQIIALELDIERGIAPPVEIISTVRNQLYSILDGRYRNPGAIGGFEAETLLLRLHNIYTRAYQIRHNQIRAGSHQPIESTRPVPSRDHQHVYLLSSPTGYQAALAPPNVRFRPPPVSTLPSFPQQAPIVTGPSPAPVAPENLQHPIQPAMENIVRQAILNQGGQDVQPDVFARNVRRMWLFIRLYFFCYLFSDPGTWSRIFYVSMAVVVALLSETGFPGRVRQVIIDPVQRHLEGLIHGGEQQIRPDGNTQNDANRAAGVNENGRVHRGFFPTGLQQGLRAAERSIVLFIASLVPGVGERQVEVRNAAAEAARNAERAREEERQQQNQNDAANAVPPNAPVENEAIQNDRTTPVIPENERAGQQ